MTRKIYVRSQDGRLQGLEERGFELEDDLQSLLEQYPDLLAGDQMNEQDPRRWLLVSREASVPDREEGSGRWSLDHLFLDQDGIPTLVEVKRSTDTRLRREVVGQMLDYAANGVAYWPPEKIRAEVEALHGDSDGLIQDLVGDADIEAFWQKVKTNLQAGRIRLLFVADEVPKELRRIVEFLNEQMDPAEVLAVAIRQYMGGDLQTLVPQVMGQTAQAETRKASGGRPTRQWDEASFFAELERRHDEDTVKAARALYQWAQKELPRMDWGKGASSGSCYPVRNLAGRSVYPMALWTYGKLEFQFQYMVRQGPPFDERQHRLELIRRLNEIEGFAIREDQVDRRPSIPLSLLAPQKTFEHFTRVMDWYLRRCEARD